MDWSTPQPEHVFSDATPAPLGALQAVLAAAERLGVTRCRLLAAAESAVLDDSDRAALARLRGAVPHHDEFVTRVRAVMARLLAAGPCGVDDVAKTLAVSPRTLQRRLERAGTTFGDLWDETRRDAALAHLRNPRLPIKEAAFLLGFSEPSTFYRAFRRWTGDTPANYRRAFAS